VLDQPGCLGIRDQYCPDDEVCQAKFRADRMVIAIEHIHIRRHDVVEISQPVHIDVEDRDVRLETGGDFGRIGADNSATQDRDERQRKAASHLQAFQMFRPFLDAHPPGNLAHRCEQRQLSTLVAQRFVGDAGCPDRIIASVSPRFAAK